MKLKKPLPKWAPVAGIVALALLVGLGGWKFVVSPQNTKAASLQQQTAGVQQQIAQNLAAAAAAKNTSSSAPSQPIRVADLYKLAKAMPSNDDVPDLLIELSRVTRESGVKVTTLSPSASTPSATGGGGTIPISLNVSGDFYSVTDLLYRLRNLVWVRNGALEATGRLFSIDSVNLTPTAGRTVTATITMHAFTYGGASTAPTQAPVAPAPVGTDTTATTTTDTSSGGPSAAGAP